MADPVEADLTELAGDAAGLLDEAMVSLTETAPGPLELEALAVLLGLPWTMGDERPAARDVLLDAVRAREEPLADDLLGVLGDLFPHSGLDGTGTPRLALDTAWAAVAGEAECVALVLGVGDDLAVPAYVILERAEGAVGGGLRDAPRPVAEVRAEVEAFVGQLDAVTPLEPAAARERVRRLLVRAEELGLPQRESFALDRPLLAHALQDDLRTWPLLALVPDAEPEAHVAPAAGGSESRARQDGAKARRAKRKQAKAARRRNRR